jgi:hypothetical protein
MHIVEITHAMLNEKNFPNYFWAEVVTTTIYIMNRTPIAIIHGMTLEEKFIGKNQMSHTLECLVALHTCMFLMRRDQN